VQNETSSIPTNPAVLSSSLPLDLLLARDFLMRLVGQNTNCQAAAEMLGHLCWDNVENTKKVLDSIFDGIRSNLFVDDLSPVVEVLGRLLAMEDSLKRSRMEYGLHAVSSAMEQSSKQRHIVLAMLQTLLSLAKAHESARPVPPFPLRPVPTSARSH
jgi:hypothetical protein